MEELASLPGWVLCGILIATGVAVSVSCLLLVRRYVPLITMHGEQIRPAATVCAILGSMLAIILAFVMVTTWQRYNEQNTRIVLEACELGNIYRDSRGLGGDREKVIQSHIRKYTESLIKYGWPDLAEGRENRKTWSDFNNLYSEIISFSPRDDKERIILSKMIDHLNKLADFRRTRQLNSQVPIIPGVIWAILFFAAFISVSFTFFFEMGNLWIQIVITSVYAIVLSLFFFLIVLLNYPYRSSIKITPWPIERLLDDVYPMADAGKIDME